MIRLEGQAINWGRGAAVAATLHRRGSNEHGDSDGHGWAVLVRWIERDARLARRASPRAAGPHGDPLDRQGGRRQCVALLLLADGWSVARHWNQTILKNKKLK